MSNIRTVTVDDDKIEQAQKNKQGRQPGMKDDARRIGVPDDSELSPQTYLVKRDSFINGMMVSAGQIVRLPDGIKPGKFFEPVRVVRRNKDAEGATPAPATKAAQNKTEQAETKDNPDKAEKPDALGDIPATPIPANAPRGAAAAKLKAAGHQSGGDDDGNI